MDRLKERIETMAEREEALVKILENEVDNPENSYEILSHQGKWIAYLNVLLMIKTEKENDSDGK